MSKRRIIDLVLVRLAIIWDGAIAVLALFVLFILVSGGGIYRIGGALQVSARISPTRWPVFSRFSSSGSPACGRSRSSTSAP